MEWLKESYKEIIGLVLTAAAGGFGIRYLLDFINKWRKTTKESIHSTDQTNLTQLQITNDLAKEWLQTASAAKDALWETKEELLQVRDELRQARSDNEALQRRVDRAERGVIKSGRLLQECFEIMKQAGMDISALERKVEAIHGTDPPVKVEDVQVFDKGE